MRVREFLASTPDSDYRGTSSADRATRSGLQQWLLERGLVRAGEYLLGVELTTRENLGTHLDPVHVTALMVNRGDYPSIQAMLDASSLVAVRLVAVDMSLVEFFGLYRRLSISFSTNGMLTNRRYAFLDS